jgi:hypothetical protein
MSTNLFWYPKASHCLFLALFLVQNALYAWMLHDLMVYGGTGVEVQFHSFLTPKLGVDEWPDSFPGRFTPDLYYPGTKRRLGGSNHDSSVIQPVAWSVCRSCRPGCCCVTFVLGKVTKDSSLWIWLVTSIR